MSFSASNNESIKVSAYEIETGKLLHKFDSVSKAATKLLINGRSRNMKYLRIGIKTFSRLYNKRVLLIAE
jgi:hypothetical protein